MQTTKTIYIIGAGAIGKALAALLQHQGRNVMLVRGQVDDIPGYVEPVVVELPDGKIIKVEVKVSSMAYHSIFDGITVITSKSYGNCSLAKKLKEKTGDSPLVILQNGLNVERPFMDEGFPEVHRCVVFASSQYTVSNRLRFKPAAISPVGIVKGSPDKLSLIIESLDNPYFQFQPEPAIQPVIWIKTIINSVFNSVCPLLETDNGIFFRNPKALKIAREIVDECIVAASAAGIKLDPEQVIERLLLISKTSDGQLISTYQDILHSRKTEIRTFNFAIAAIAENAGKQQLVKNTKLLGELIDIKAGLSTGS